MAHHNLGDFVLSSDYDVLALQNIFLTSGYHTFCTQHVYRTRNLICSLVSAIPSFSSVACLTLDGGPLPDGFVDMYQELTCCTDLSPLSIDDFLLNEFYYDFLWVECTPALLESSWFGHFRQRLYDFNLLKSLSVLALEIT